MVRTFICLSSGNAHSCSCNLASSAKKAEKDVPKPLAIFHKVAMVGLDSPRSICPNMALETLVNLAVASKLRPFCWRKDLMCLEMWALKLSSGKIFPLCVLAHSIIIFTAL